MFEIELNGSRIAFDVRGSGGTMIALHSSACTGRQWDTLTGDLERHHCVFTPDLPGYGRSSVKFGKAGPSLEAEAKVIFDLVEAWQEPVHLVGHSYGGAIALQIALQNPHWINTLTVIEPTVFNLLRFGEPSDRRLHGQIDALRGVMNAAAASGDPNTAMGQFIDFWNGPGTWARKSLKAKLHLAAQTGQVVNNFAAGDEITWEIGSLHALPLPVQILMGTQSPKPARRMAELLARAIPGAALRRINGAGHMAPLTHPHVVGPLIATHANGHTMYRNHGSVLKAA